ncbi:hypothetical protein AB0D46_15575 [Streptomyces sp. NPDC048383]|uniref:hypothetical protein n=1 Tax=Streptomyces sp. NPDC048383 TaxID=3155386 RepID=UPI00342AEC18
MGPPLRNDLDRKGIILLHLTAFLHVCCKSLPQSALADVAQALLLPGTVGTAVGALTGSLVKALRERRQTVQALAGCARLGDLLKAEPDLDSLSF